MYSRLQNLERNIAKLKKCQNPLVPRILELFTDLPYMTSKHSEPAFSDLTSSGQAPCASALMKKLINFAWQIGALQSEYCEYDKVPESSHDSGTLSAL
jgi:hypothetical protein